MKITQVVRFDDVVKDNDVVSGEYHGYKLEIDSSLWVTIYDNANEVFVGLVVNKDTPIADLLNIENYLWSLGYSEVKFMDNGGYKTIADIRKDRFFPKDCYGKPKRSGPVCPKCGVRLYKTISKQCDCGWTKSVG